MQARCPVFAIAQRRWRLARREDSSIEVYTHRRGRLSGRRLAKARLLAPFSARHANRASILRLPKELREIALHAIYMPKARLLYVKNPKAASTTILRFLYAAEYRRAHSGIDIHEDPALPHGEPWLLTAVGALSSRDARKFSFVRDPVARCVSGFKDFFLLQRNSESRRHLPYITRFGFVPGGDPLTNFDAYLDYLEAMLAVEAWRLDGHFSRQFDNLRPDLIAYDFIGKVERTENDLDRLAAQLDLVQIETDAPDDAAINRTGARFTPNANQITRIRELYAIDFEAFYPDC